LLASAIVVVVLLMVITGALVAGIRAGYAYNTFPLMNGHLVPPEIFMIEPWWRNFGYNMATVQFDHRLGAWILAALVAGGWALSFRSAGRPARTWADALLVMFLLQFALGAATLLSGVQVPLAALHQAGSVLVFTCAIGLRHAM
jgi:cytochrome c oxidase assembly protein subunit 15